MVARCKIINRPGKFEGEPEWVEHFWELAISGCSDEDRDCVRFGFRINREDCAEFPGCFDIGDLLYLWEDENGFVHHELR